MTLCSTPLASPDRRQPLRTWAHRLGCLAVTLAYTASAQAAPPLNARGTFVSHAYAFTFRAPARVTYCRLADDWTGSDHGTILFLAPPSDCDGAGYPSISRGFAPDATPRIEVYYARWDSEIDRPSPCRRIGNIYLLGRTRPLCRAVSNGMLEITTTGHYTADGPAVVIITLVTTPARLHHDLPELRALVRTAHPCSVPWQDAEGRTRIEGSGKACPAEGDFY